MASRGLRPARAAARQGDAGDASVPSTSHKLTVAPEAPEWPLGRIWTARYANPMVGESGLAPVRITVGFPRFRLTYELAASIRELAPTRAMLALGNDEFDVAYRQRLDALGIEGIRALLDGVRALAGADPVLLCFERPGMPCHRRAFAAWWTNRTGEPVVELPEVLGRGGEVPNRGQREGGAT